MTRWPWWVVQLGDAERRLVMQVLESRFLNDGEMTARFERELAALLGVKHVVAVTSGTAAIFLALASLGIGRGDEVIVPDLTFMATANAVTLTGATPVLVDIDPTTLTMDAEACRRAISPRTRAIVPVHVSGRAADLPAILHLAAARGIPVVEDAAEALSSSSSGRPLGTQGMLGCLSFSPHKIMTTGQGGAVLTHDDRLHVRLRELKDQGRPIRGTGGADWHRAIGYNFKFTDLQAAVGLGQLPSLASRRARLQSIYQGYVERLRDVPGIRLMGFAVDRGESPQWVDALVEEREAFIDHLGAHGAECRRFWFPLHTQPPYRQPDERFPHSTALAPKALWLPSALTLSDHDVAAICHVVTECLRRLAMDSSRASVAAAHPRSV